MLSHTLASEHYLLLNGALQTNEYIHKPKKLKILNPKHWTESFAEFN